MKLPLTPLLSEVAARWSWSMVLLTHCELLVDVAMGRNVPLRFPSRVFALVPPRPPSKYSNLPASVHSRIVSEVVSKEGEAAILWFKQVLEKELAATQSRPSQTSVGLRL